MNGASAPSSPKITTFVALISNPWAATAAATAEGQPAIRGERVAADLSSDFQSWTRAISKGDEGAFNQFYEWYSLRLYKFLLVLTKGNDLDAREVLQTSVLKAARGFKVFQSEEQLWHWLCRLARNAFIDLCRSRARDERFVVLPDLETSFHETPQPLEAMTNALHHALNEVSEEERELMHEVYIDQRSLADMAREKCQSYKALESRVGRLRHKLRTSLLKYLRHEENS